MRVSIVELAKELKTILMGKPNAIRTSGGIASKASRALRSSTTSRTVKQIAAVALGN